MKNYFSHDYNARNDPKIEALILDHGAAGYGIYWATIESLYESNNNRLYLKSYTFKAIAKQMQANAEQIEILLKKCIDEYELFETDGNEFWSNSVLKRIGKQQKISEIRSKIGKKGAIAKQNLAIAKQIPIKKERKKEIKKEIKKFIPPTIDEIKQYFKENGYKEETAIKMFNSYSVADWIDSQGKPVRNWKQKAINVWFKDENKLPVRKFQP